jgi:PTS system mannitol-specific IIA component
MDDVAADRAPAPISDLLAPGSVRLASSADDWEAAVRQVGELLVAAGAVAPGYIDLMLERDRDVSTFVGEGFAIPHGTLAGRDLVERDALAVVQFPDGVDWHGERVEMCVGIAAAGGSHVPILAQLAEILMEPDQAEALRTAATVDAVFTHLTPSPEP